MKSTMKKWLALALALTLLLSLAACSGNNTANSSGGQDQTDQTEDQSGETQQTGEETADGQLVSEGMVELQFAQRFSIEKFEGGYRMITAGSEGSGGPKKYMVVPEGMSVPEGLEEDVIILQLPLDNIYCASSSMMSLTAALGALDHIKLCALDYDSWQLDKVREQMDAGKLTYSGSYKEPDYEMMTANDIQFYLDTTMIDGYPEVLEKFEELGIPNMVEDSALEGHPMGRIEWIKVLGVLYGMEDEANAYFADQVEKFNAACAEEPLGKTVALGYITSSGKCYARNGGDYIAQLIEMAGGDYVCADMAPDETGNTSMTFEEWYDEFVDADYLFYYNLGQEFYSIQDMIDYNPLFADFKAVQNGNVWVTCDGFSQKSADIVGVITDMNTVLTSEDNTVTTDFIVKIS